jgi:phenylalanyl-tRNA synthetase beta chain
VRAVWSWLLDLVELPDTVGPDDGAAALTGAGLEVEEIETIGGELSGVVIAEVVGKRKHPNADKLTLVDVIDKAGGAATEVVCGAPNVPEPGGRVLWARPGAVLPGGFQIAPKEIKGVTSAGMLCAEDELGLGDDHDGIIVLGDDERGAPLGALAQDALGLRDIVFDIGVPANRPDANGHLGIARELAALCGGRLRPVDADLAAVTDDSLDAAALVSVAIEDQARCLRYAARVIDGLTVRPSPRWLRRRLEAVGVRPLSNLVDVSNYVMFELGQPLHAFDYRVVDGARIIVRRAAAGEKMKTLDDVERTLTDDDLLICDARGGVAVAGVMGGADSEVRDDTTRVLLETACFEPTGIRRTGRRLNLHSESSHRFERGVDPNGVDLASARAAKLLAELGGGRVARGVVDVYPKPVAPVQVAIRPARATQLTGVELSAADVRRSLESIQLEIAGGTDDNIEVEVPTSRPDLTREVDLIEEVIRLYGFEKVPASLPRDSIAPSRRADPREPLARRALVQAGLDESVTYAFTSPQRLAALGLPDGDPRMSPIPVVNPLRGEHSLMRTTLLPNLFGTLAYNLTRDVADTRLFEVGMVFLPNPGGELPTERRTAAGVMCGARDGWLTPGEPLDFFDVKAPVERLLAAVLGAPAREVGIVAAGDIPYLHPGIAARVVLPDGAVAGVLGEVHPNTRRALDIDVPCFAFELDLERLSPSGPIQMEPIPRFPAITRDVSFFVDAEVPASRVEDVIRARPEALLTHVTVLEDYRAPTHVPPGKKGMLWSMTYRSAERTLTDAEVDDAHAAIVARLLADLPAEQR